MRLLGTLSTARLKTDRAFRRQTRRWHLWMPTSRRLRDAPSNLPTGSAVWPMLFVLILIVLVFAGIRIAVDWPNVAAGIVPQLAAEPAEAHDHATRRVLPWRWH